jgi:hypothetical protein
MSRCAGHTLRYRIVVASESPALLAGLGDNVHVESAERGRTTLIVALQDDAEFWGLMERLQDLALHLLSLNELSAGEGLPR